MSAKDMAATGLTFRSETERQQYEHCRDNLFPCLRRLKKVASKRLAVKRMAEAEKNKR